MPRLIVKTNYSNNALYNKIYLEYIATREGVESLPLELRTKPATDKQLMLIHQLLEDNPDLKHTDEYQAYLEKRTIENATEFISAAVEENVDDLSVYMNYIATRPRAEKIGNHGLFSDEDNLDLEAEKDSIGEYHGNVWRFIISLTREDAERIGFDNASAWRDLMRSQRTMLAEQMKIPLSDLKWYGSFHNERHHPHIHVMVYSKNPSKGYLSKQGLEGIKSALGNDLFQDDLLSIYSDMTKRRDELTEFARMRVSDLTDELTTVTPEECENMTLLKAQLAELSKQLTGVKGKMVYGYLQPALKNLVDEATDTLAKDQRIVELYNLWYEKKYDTLRTYTDHLPEQIPLGQNKEFKAIKNAIIKAAVRMRDDVELPIDDTPIDDAIDEGDRFTDFIESVSNVDEAEQENYRTYRLGKEYLKRNDVAGAIRLFEKSLENEQLAAFAAYSLGKIYLRDPNFKDPDKAIKYLTQASENGNHYADYLLGKAYLYDKDFPFDRDEGLRLLQRAADLGNSYAMRLIHSVNDHVRNQAVASIFTGAARTFKNAFRNQQYDPKHTSRRSSSIDSKLRREIEAKKRGQDYAD